MKASLPGWYASNPPLSMKLQSWSLHREVGGWTIAVDKIIRACTKWRLPSQAGMHQIYLYLYNDRIIRACTKWRLLSQVGIHLIAVGRSGLIIRACTNKTFIPWLHVSKAHTRLHTCTFVHEFIYSGTQYIYQCNDMGAVYTTHLPVQ